MKKKTCFKFGVPNSKWSLQKVIKKKRCEFETRRPEFTQIIMQDSYANNLGITQGERYLNREKLKRIIE